MRHTLHTWSCQGIVTLEISFSQNFITVFIFLGFIALGCLHIEVAPKTLSNRGTSLLKDCKYLILLIRLTVCRRWVNFVMLSGKINIIFVQDTTAGCYRILSDLVQDPKRS